MTPIDQPTLETPYPWPRPELAPPHLYAALRSEHPVVRVDSTDGKGIWIVSRYDDVRAVLANPNVSADLSNENFPNFANISRAVVPFLRMDPPQHSQYRRLLTKYFSIKQVENLRIRVQELVDSKIDAMLAKPTRSADLITEFALPIPSTVLSWMLGIPSEDQVWFNERADAALSAHDQNRPDAKEFAAKANADIQGYIAELAAAKKAQDEPPADLLAELAAAAKRGEITDVDVIANGWVLLIAGHDTTASMIGTGTYLLLQHPDVMDRLRQNPSEIRKAIEEMLRYLTIVHGIILRFAKEDIEVGGTIIPAGDAIAPLVLSANHDGTHFSDPQTLDIDRNAKDHLAFGYGIHQCLGQPLARMELAVAFETLLRRLPDLALAVAPDEVPLKNYAAIMGASSVPVTY